MLYKKITKAGGITIPRSLRGDVGIMPGTPVSIVADDNGIHISKYMPVCRICGCVDDVSKVMDFEICVVCAKEVLSKYGDGV